MIFFEPLLTLGWYGIDGGMIASLAKDPSLANLMSSCMVCSRGRRSERDNEHFETLLIDKGDHWIVQEILLAASSASLILNIPVSYNFGCTQTLGRREGWVLKY